MLGSQVDGMSDNDLIQVVDKVSVFAKMTPQQKARVITLLQKQGH